jgi:hypothetical protein
MIKAMRARNWNLEGAIEELVDNSVGHGRATEVTIDIDSAPNMRLFGLVTLRRFKPSAMAAFTK